MNEDARLWGHKRDSPPSFVSSQTLPACEDTNGDENNGVENQ